jgi:hypothetical protein
MRVRYTLSAFAERERMFAYLEARNPQAARKVVGLINSAFSNWPTRHIRDVAPIAAASSPSGWCGTTSD